MFLFGLHLAYSTRANHFVSAFPAFIVHLPLVGTASLIKVDEFSSEPMRSPGAHRVWETLEIRSVL